MASDSGSERSVWASPAGTGFGADPSAGWASPDRTTGHNHNDGHNDGNNDGHGDNRGHGHATNEPARDDPRAGGDHDDTPTVRVAADSKAVGRPRREGLRGTILVLVGTVVLVLGITVLGLTAPTGIESPEAYDPPGALPQLKPTPTLAAQPSTPAGPGVYQVPGDLCQAADFTALRPTFDQLGDLRPGQIIGNDGVEYALCDGTTGNDTTHGSFSLRASVYADPAVARREFQADRDRADATSKTVNVEGPHDPAYVYQQVAGGYTVEINDGNLRIRMSWTAAGASAASVPGIIDVLVRVCRSTMMLLREN